MPPAFASLAKLALCSLLALATAGCFSRSSHEDDRYEVALTGTQYARVETAIHALPQPLYQALANRQLYRLESAGLPPPAADEYPAIRLSPELLADPSTTDAALQRSILLRFFSARLDQLSLFCQAGATCQVPSDGYLQLQHFFSGRELHSGTTSSQASADEQLRGAYAFHATEYFVDPAYRCKRPLVAKVLEAVWSYRVDAQQCNERVPFLVSEENGASKIRWVDPRRVYAVHLLFAGATGNSMSRFGHVTLRIVQCAKERTVVDQRCEEDLFDHLSLGFKANIEDLDISLWKGVKGGYPMKLYASSFIDTYRKYSTDELRELHSLPLVLSPQSQHLLIQALAEMHWSYTADYRFFTQNCATEVQWLLGSTAFARQPSAPALFSEKRYRPDKLFDDAKKSAHFRGETLANLTTAEQQGYYFPSAEKYYQLAVDSIAVALPESAAAGARTPQEWQGQSARLRAELWLKPALGHSARKAHTGHAALVLEGWVARQLRRQLLESLILYYGSVFQSLIADEHMLDNHEKRLLSDCVNALKTADTAGSSVDGIPQAPREVDASVCSAKDQQLAALMQRLSELFPVPPAQQENIGELTDTLANIQAIRDSAGL